MRAACGNYRAEIAGVRTRHLLAITVRSPLRPRLSLRSCSSLVHWLVAPALVITTRSTCSVKVLRDEPGPRDRLGRRSVNDRNFSDTAILEFHRRKKTTKFHLNNPREKRQPVFPGR